MAGFFSKEETKSKTRPDGRVLSCVSCGLFKNCKTPKMQPFGNFKKGILNIGEAPSEIDDDRGKPWQGKFGKFLQLTYKDLGIDLFEDCLNINAVNCLPLEDGDVRTPSNYEIECCRKMVFKVIDEYKPKVIVLFGQAAVYSLIGHRWKKDFGNIMKWRGWTIPDQDFKAWLCPVFTPSSVQPVEDGVEFTIWRNDLEQALDLYNKTFPEYIEPKIEIIEDLSVLNDIKDCDIAFDYETTGIKSQATGHRIICASVADSQYHAYVFMMPSSPAGRRPFIDLLKNPNVGKIAQNMKFEDTWTMIRLKTEVQNWVWDTMIASHILDNRPGVTGLKLQTYLQFGIIDYASEVSPYLSAEDNTNDNAINRIMQLVEKPGGKELLMKYCALDSIYEYRLAKKQMYLMGYDELPF